MDDGAYADDKPLAKRWEEEEDEEDQLTEEYGMPHFVTLHQESAFPLGAGVSPRFLFVLMMRLTAGWQHLYKKLKAGEIDLDAEYQRGVTWSAPRQSGLIDSLERVSTSMTLLLTCCVLTMDGTGHLRSSVDLPCQGETRPSGRLDMYRREAADDFHRKVSPSFLLLVSPC